MADVEGCIGTEADEGVAAEFAAVIIIGSEAEEVYLAADGGGCNRHEKKTFID